MERFLKKLAPTLDSWAAEKRAILTESDAVVVVGGLSADDAVALVAMVKDFPEVLTIEDATDALVRLKDIAEDFAPFKISITKPPVPANVGAVVTNTAFSSWLSRSPEHAILWCARLETAFETYNVRFAPWGDLTEFVSAARPSTARKVVREGGPVAQVPDDLRPWLLKEGATAPWKESPAKIWVDLAAETLFRSLTNEVEAGGVLMFRGPPVVRYSVSKRATDFLSPTGLDALQAAARWVLESDREVETRHMACSPRNWREQTWPALRLWCSSRGGGASVGGSKDRSATRPAQTQPRFSQGDGGSKEGSYRRNDQAVGRHPPARDRSRRCALRWGQYHCRAFDDGNQRPHRCDRNLDPGCSDMCICGRCDYQWFSVRRDPAGVAVPVARAALSLSPGDRI
jgi:hypothetical protein